MEKSNVVLAQLTDTVVATERFDVVLPVMGYGQFCPFFWEAECETNLLQLKRAKRSLGELPPSQVVPWFWDSERLRNFFGLALLAKPHTLQRTTLRSGRAQRWQ